MLALRLGAFRHQHQHVSDACTKDGHIHDDEHDERCRKDERRVVRHRVLGPHHAIDHPGLASDLGGEPSGQQRHQTRGAHQHREAQKKLRPVELIAPACPGAPKAKQQHEEAQPDHDPEGPENDRGVRPVLGGEILQAANLVVPAMGQDDAAQVRNLKGITCCLSGHVGPAKQDQRHALGRLVLPVAFDRGDFRRLMLKGVEPVLVADDDLYRRDDEHHPHGHRKHRAHGRRVTPFEQMPCARSPDEKRHRQIGRYRHVREAVWE